MELSLRKLILLLVLTILLSVGLVYAMSYGFKPNTSTQTFSEVKGVNEHLGLELTLTLEKAEFALGEPINITLTVTNIGNQTAQFADFISWWDFVVYNDTNAGHNGLYQWLRSGHIFPFIGRDIALDPGMGLTNEAMFWPQTCNKTVGDYGAPNSPVSPGIYYIVGMYDDVGRDFDYNLETAPIQITIAQP